MADFAYSLNAPFPAECRGGAVTLGNFDGVHRGHRALLAETIRQARCVNGPAVAVTFDPPPAALLRPQSFQPFLTTVPYRCELLHAAGADHVVTIRTCTELLALEAREFFERILRDGFQAKSVIEGFNFAFGRGRRGSGELLKTWGEAAGMTVTLVDAQFDGGVPISSSRVRAAIGAGEVGIARGLLGRPYRVVGRVTTGNRRGRSLGFPTANLAGVENLVPGPGVYAARAIHGGKIWNAAAHLGPRPTFAEAVPSVEIHLLGFHGDLYGQSLAVDFIEKVREPKSFASADELKRQIQRDVAAIQTSLDTV